MASKFNFFPSLGDEQFFYEDFPKVPKDNLGSSAVISGCNPWTVFE